MVRIKHPVFIWGPPGVGKSQVVRQVGDELGLNIIDIRAVLLDPVDLRGIPSINGEYKAHWCVPSFLPAKGRGILFLDELNAAPPLVQAACYQLILDRKLGEYELPDGWAIIAAGNRETDKAVTHRMPSPLANRFSHLEFEVNLEDWMAWAQKRGVRPEVMAFLKFRPGLLYDFDPRRNEKAFPTPRSWEFVSNLLEANPSQNIKYDLLKGTVGEGAAAELSGFLEVFESLPDPEEVLRDPGRVEIPFDPATIYALCGALSQKAGPDTIEGIIRFADRLPVEFGVLLVRESVLTDKSLTETRAFADWASKNADILI